MSNFKNIYFVGIGGIGMSAIARHYNAMGYNVAGYDRTSTPLTNEIELEGIDVTFEDSVERIPQVFLDKESTRVVYTPAIPKDNKILNYFFDNDFLIIKRAALLGLLTEKSQAIGVAGTHGKTTTSTLIAHILRQSSLGCSAFLGGVANNYETNYWNDLRSPYIVTEADEFDRSFLHLHPTFSVITAMDADHLDVYGTKEEMDNAFRKYASQTKTGGALIYKLGVPLTPDDVAEDTRMFSYALRDEKANYFARNIRLVGRRYHFDFVSPIETIENIELAMPGLHNVENSIAAIAITQAAGATPAEIKAACSSFMGNRRRFQYRIDRNDFCLIDDYAHHPEEIRSMLSSVREVYPNDEITLVFQPHLFSRTRDFADGFVSALQMAQHVLLLDIYPAREQPIPGVTSEMLANRIPGARLTTPERLVADLKAIKPKVLVMMGAGNIDKLVPIVAQNFE